MPDIVLIFLPYCFNSRITPLGEGTTVISTFYTNEKPRLEAKATCPRSRSQKVGSRDDIAFLFLFFERFRGGAWGRGRA